VPADTADTAALAERARADGRFGIDTEFVPEGRYRPLLCLIQIVVGEEIVLLDPLADAGRGDFDPAPIAGLLADPAVEVVLHAGRQDVAILRREWATDVTSVFDTQVAAGFAGFPAQAGYLGLLADALRIRLEKSASFTRWDTRPLTEEQLVYAGEDVEHLLPLADDLQRRLRGADRLGWAQEECQAIADASDVRDPAEVWRRLPRSGSFSPRDRAVARELAAWREGTAEREDKPLGSVVKDQTLAELVKRKPSDVRSLGQIRGIFPDVVKRRGRDLIAAVERGREAEPIVLEDEAERLHAETGDGPTLALAEALVRARALEAGLAYELIAARADLAPIVVSVRRDRPEPAVRTLAGWRRALVGDELLELLRGGRSLRVDDGGRVAVSRT